MSMPFHTIPQLSDKAHVRSLNLDNMDANELEYNAHVTQHFPLTVQVKRRLPGEKSTFFTKKSVVKKIYYTPTFDLRPKFLSNAKRSITFFNCKYIG